MVQRQEGKRYCCVFLRLISILKISRFVYNIMARREFTVTTGTVTSFITFICASANIILPCEIITAVIATVNWRRVRKNKLITFREPAGSARKYEIGQGIFRSITNIHTWNFLFPDILNDAPEALSTFGISFHHINMI